VRLLSVLSCRETPMLRWIPGKCKIANALSEEQWPAIQGSGCFTGYPKIPGRLALLNPKGGTERRSVRGFSPR